MNRDTVAAHQHSARHCDEVMRSESCGCFYCCRIFPPSEVTEWIADGQTTGDRTALCPHCSIDAVIGSASGFPITKAFLSEMKQHWF